MKPISFLETCFYLLVIFGIGVYHFQSCTEEPDLNEQQQEAWREALGAEG